MVSETLKKRIVAIDPGSSGGIAWRTETGQIQAQKMPDTEGDILSLLRRLKTTCDVIYLEQVGGYIGRPQPGSAMFKFGRHNGFLIGVIMSLEIPLEMVTPQKWQKHLGLVTASSCASQQEWKNKLKSLAQRKFPSANVTLATADALLILDFAEKL